MVYYSTDVVIFHFGHVDSKLAMAEAKKKPLVQLALLAAGILLILAQYQLHEKQQEANLDIGKELSCNHAARQTVLPMSLLEL